MASIGDLTATLRANTTDFTAKMDAATASSAKLAMALQDPVAQLRQLGIQAGQATGEMRAMLIAQQQAIIEGMKAKGLVILNGQVAYSATAAAEANAKLAESQVAVGLTGQGLDSNAQRLERSIGSLVTRMVGIPMQVGSIGTSLTRSILGTTGALAAVVAIGLVVSALSSLIDHFRAAAKAAEESSNRIIDAWKKATLQNEFTDANTAMDNVLKAQARLAFLKKEAQNQDAIRAAAAGQGGGLATVTPEDIDAATTALTQANQQYAVAQRALNDALAGRPGVKANESAAKQRAGREDELVSIGLATLNGDGTVTVNPGYQSLLSLNDRLWNFSIASLRKYYATMNDDQRAAAKTSLDLQLDQMQRQDDLRQRALNGKATPFAGMPVTGTLLQDRTRQAAEAGLTLEQSLGLSKADWDVLLRDYDEGQRKLAEDAKKANEKLVAEQKAAHDRLVAQVRRQGQELADALASGFVEGDLGNKLLSSLKRLFENVIARLIQDKVFKGLEDALVSALEGGSKGGGGGSLFGNILGGLIGAGAAVATGGGTAIAGGGVGALATKGAISGGASLARGGGPSTLIVNASGSMPRALGPVEHARDAQWLAVFAETARVAPSLGIRMGVS